MPERKVSGRTRRRLEAVSAAGMLLAGTGLVGHAVADEPGLPAPVASSNLALPTSPLLPDTLDVQPLRRAAPDRARPADPLPHVLPRAEPVRVRVPRIGVDSELVALGLRPDGSLEVPDEAHVAGWYTGAPTPGETGPAVIAGHVDSWQGPGVFFRLRELVPGDRVEVDRADGSRAVFVVQAVEQYAKNALPTERVYGDLDYPGLRLITCGGEFDETTRHYRSNVVVYARMLGVHDG